MKTQMVRQTMFTTGEVDQINWKRTDVEEYLTAAQSLKNMEIVTTGSARKRKGTEKMLDATNYALDYSCMYDFVDKNQDHYLIISDNKQFHIFDAPTESQTVVTRRGTQVVTIRGSRVVCYENDFKFIQTVSTPYETTDLDSIDYSQANDALVLTHPDYPPARIFVSSYSPLTFAYEVLNIYPYPSFDFNKINYNGFTVSLSASGNTLTFHFTGVGADPGFNNDWIGGQIIGAGTSDVSPIGYAIITAVSYSGSGGGTVTFTATIQIPFETATFYTSGSQYSIRQPAWSASIGYPAKVLFFQNRLWFASTRSLPTGIFGSKINAPINFDVGIGNDADAIVYLIGQNDCGQILWMNGGKQLEIYSDNYEFACPQDLDTALTPSTFSVRQQSAYGASSSLKPLSYINDSYYASKTGKALINFHFTGVGLTYAATNISAASSHLVKKPFNRALLRGDDDNQDNFIYFANSDNTITTFQFSSETKLAALTPVIFQGDIRLIDIVTIRNEVYLLKHYVKTGKYAIERFVDDVKIDGTRTASMASSGLVTGLDDLNGYTVQVVYKNQDFGQYLVGDQSQTPPWEPGTIVVTNRQEIEDTVFIGLLYDVELIPMYIYGGKLAAPFFKNIVRIYVDYYNSLNFYINGKLVNYQVFKEISEGKPLTPKTDTAIVDVISGWERFSTLSITQSSPFDLQILSIGYQIETAVM